MHNKFKKIKYSILSYGFSFVLFFIIGWNFAGTKNINQIALASIRDPSNVEIVKTSFNDYKNLPCPTKSEYQSYISMLNIQDSKFVGNICDDSTHKGKLAKSLKLLNSLKFKIEYLKTPLSKSIENPMNYLKQNIVMLSYDHETHYGAYNQNRSVYLSKSFFELPPLYAVEIFIHESRHSSQFDPNHTTCKAGDQPGKAVACDEWFRTDDYMGAYSIGLIFDLALMQSEIIQLDSDKEFLKSLALMYLSNRFNKVQGLWGLPIESIYTVNQVGIVKHLHPFLHSETQLNANEFGRIKRIKNDSSSQALVLFSEENTLAHMYPYNLQSKPVKSKVKNSIDYESIVYDPMKVAYFSIDTDGVIWIFSSGSKEYEKAKFQSSSSKPIRIFQGRGNWIYVLLENGLLGAVQADEIQVITAQDPQNSGWAEVVSNAIFRDMFFLNNKGTLYYRLFEETALKKSGFQMPNAKKYIEGATFRTYLDTNGVMQIWRYNSKKLNLHKTTSEENSKWIDIAHTRNFEPNWRLHPKTVSKKFLSDCEIKAARHDPWTGRSMGLNAEGTLVFEGVESQCLKSKWKVKASDKMKVELVGAEDKVEETFNHFVTPKLRLSSGNETIEIFPYQTEL